MTWTLAGSELQPISFAGLSLTGTDGGPGDYSAEFMVGFDIAAQYRPEVVESEAEGQFPQYVRTDPDSKVIPLGIHLTAVESTQAMIDALKKVFTASRDIDYLRVRDADGNTRRMRVKSLGLAPWLGDDQYNYVASLEAPEPIWEDDTADVIFYNVSGNAAVSSKTWEITNSGNEECYPVVTLNAYSDRIAAVGNDWMMPIVIAWRSSLEGTDSQGLGYPIDLTDAAWNTSGLADYTDASVRAWLDGVEIDRYIVNGSTTGTSVWASVPFQPARTGTLAANITGSATSLAFTSPDDLAAFPDTGFVLIDSECIAYRGKSASGLDNLLRGQRGTAVAGLHSAGATIYWIEHDIRLSWGAFSASVAPGLEAADNKPIIDIAQSSNLHHFYGTTDGLIEPESLRPGQWIRELRAPSTGLRAQYSSLGQTAGIVSFADIEPTVDSPQFDSLSLYTPCFVSQNITGVAVEMAVGHHLAFSVYGVDPGGFESLLARFSVLGNVDNPASGFVGDPAFSSAFVMPFDDLARVTLEGRSVMIAGTSDPGVIVTGGANIPIISVSGSASAQTFTLPQAVANEVTLRMAESADFNGVGRIRVWAPSNSPTVQGSELGDTQIALVDTSFVSHVDLTTVGQWVTVPIFLLSLGGPRGWAQAGGLAIVIVEYFSGGAGSMYIAEVGASYGGGEWWQRATATGVDWQSHFPEDVSALISSYDSEPAPTARMDFSDQTVQYKNVHVYFNPSFTPLIVRGAVASAYTLYNATLTNAQTNEVITFNCVLPIDPDQTHDLFKVDADGHVATILPDGTNGYEQAAGFAIEPSDIEHWLRILPGINNLTFSGGSGPRLAVKVYKRDRWT